MAIYTVHPIGHVENGIAELDGVVWEDVESRVVLAPEYADGLDGIEDFSHIIVICYLHRREHGHACERRLRVHPQGREDLPLVGVFATRSPKRPNPIAITVVPLIRREGNVLHVRGLDMADGTPVLDIKPYLPRGDRVENARVAEWLRRLWEANDKGDSADSRQKEATNADPGF
ncbi:MAG: tRNA (N6-threonylcarbamoyladenosine(37)-N6)-methyltransferase TrmO [Anaerolineae bacterium]|nr:tRNA (N6-threonylcarbamoyladenosine(37)-N6)-methyltransferase TrmO [Anaerolineae bacterium]